ncbi:pyruvate dehydrogenase E1 component alpha subunit [Rhodococcus opacus PD630]|uniref:pyruvate dehydrogenase (acetyl-transferring) E1 component subunit alpha n=1 Tax=Rhodococcus TaxID=1827 RepID=UPI00029CD143|nr:MULTISPECIES: pyruvate dehydrogenase (acetyl-transferring) E1 component subunit alpha [Rhodococcus]NHU46248.1 pyruvate dehydrogenase (acetyl-transferring) E1 component subunit alpha [Rhodococcus sp. A14]AHK34884.1 Pyruvate dehydrogenase E1 component subunit alpha [Rhodococcus opacus PD630]EHI39241.1 pyruvate dehydrogenase E1 component alpha subunit [Rhodococcus opacus PD630]PBC55853.1 pyruvate dehydrogenase (acetyl-transferring) E1 component subunit alpha [Rhodococcus sp. ACPA1]UDG96972.1 p
MFDNDDVVQLVTENGARVNHPDYSRYVDDVDITSVRALYEDLVVVRRIDAEATALQRQGELGLWAPLLGQEAAQVGSARALRPDDFVFASYREHGVAYCRDVDPTHMLRFWRGSTHSGWNPFEYNMTTPAIIVGAQALHATGYAMGMQFDGSDGAAITYFGDGATSQGDISEAFGFAASFNAPVVFFCQNNQWAISEPVSLQSRVSIAARGRGFGVPSVRVDGNDVLAVIAVTRAALERAREGSGPTLIEAVTYRMGPHTTSDDPSRYRPAALDEEWKRKDPLDRIRALLESAGAIDDDYLAAVQQRSDDTAAALRRGCLETVEPEPMSLFDNVYAEPHPLVDEERRQFAAYLDSFEGIDA